MPLLPSRNPVPMVGSTPYVSPINANAITQALSGKTGGGGFDWRKLLTPETIGTAISVGGGLLAGNDDPNTRAAESSVLSNYLQNKQANQLERDKALTQFNPQVDQANYQQALIRAALQRSARPWEISDLPSEIQNSMGKVTGGMRIPDGGLPASSILSDDDLKQAYLARQMDRQQVNPYARMVSQDPSLQQYGADALKRYEGNQASDQNLVQEALGKNGTAQAGKPGQAPKGYEYKLNKKTGQYELKKKGGFWSKFGKIAGIAGAGLATAFTGGLASPALAAAIGAGSGAAIGGLSGGGWKGALLGAAGGGLTGGLMSGAGGAAGAGVAKAGTSIGSKIGSGLLNVAPQIAGQINPQAGQIASIYQALGMPGVPNPTTPPFIPNQQPQQFPWRTPPYIPENSGMIWN